MKSNLQIVFRSKLLLFAILLLSVLASMFFLFKGRFFSFRLQSPVSSVKLIQEFSGSYYMGDKLGLSCRFDLNPDKTFRIRWSTDSSDPTYYEGLISVQEAQFVLDASAKIKTPAICFHRTFIPVYWGKRRYLLPNDNDDISRYIVSTFCESVKSGREPRNDEKGVVYLRTTDIRVKVIGFPFRQDGQSQCPIFAYP